MKKITLIEKALFLKENPLFGNLDLELLLPIADKLSLIEYSKDEVIFEKGEDALRMFFIIEGEVSIDRSVLSAKEFFGEEAIFNEKTRAYTAISRTDSSLITLTRNNLIGIIHECPSVAIELLEVYSLMTPSRHGERAKTLFSEQ